MKKEIVEGSQGPNTTRDVAGQGGLRDLVSRIRAGEEAAEIDLVRRFGRGVTAILDRHTRARTDAEDLYQDTFHLALRKLRDGELRDAQKLPGFLSRIARNLAIEHYRKAGRRKTDADSEAVATVAVVESSQLGSLLRHEHAALVRQVLGELANERDRQILFRFYIAEDEKDVIASDLGLTSLQFNRVLHRARQRYKKHFEERWPQMSSASPGTAIVGAILALLVTLR